MRAGRDDIGHLAGTPLLRRATVFVIAPLGTHAFGGFQEMSGEKEKITVRESGYFWSTRRETLPSNWRAIRSRILARDRRECQLRLVGVCAGRANEVDHVGDRLDHSDENLRAVCSPCHLKRTAVDAGRAGGLAAGRARRARAAARLRPQEPHPGLVPPPGGGAA